MKYIMLYRKVFRCTDCGFILSQLGGQAHFEMEDTCPACGGDLDYASLETIDKHVAALKSELHYIETAGEDA